jgi:hypothetical protein
MKHYNKTRNIKRKLKHMTRRIKKGRTSRLLFKSKVLGKQLRKLSKKFIQRGGLQQRGGATYTIKKEDYARKLPDKLIWKISKLRGPVWDTDTNARLKNISFNPAELAQLTSDAARSAVDDPARRVDGDEEKEEETSPPRVAKRVVPLPDDTNPGAMARRDEVVTREEAGPMISNMV